LHQKILIISNESRISGAELSLLALLAGLPGDRYSVVIALPEKGPLYHRLVNHYRVVLFPMKKLSRSENPLTALVHILRTGARMAAFARREAVDLVYANGIQAQVYGAVIRLFSFGKRRTIWHVRDRTPDFLLSRCCALASDRIICISQFIYDQTPGAKRKKRLIYNGLDTVTWAPMAKSRELPGLPAGTVIIGQVGQLIPWKGQDDLIRAAGPVIRRFPHVHFLIVGEDISGKNQEYIQGLKALIRAEGIAGYFSFTGFVGDSKEYINQLDVLVHCAEGEPFGRVLLEGMALEKPVIAYRSGGCAEIIEDGISGVLVEPRRPDLLAAALMAVLDDEDKRVAMGKQARARVARRFAISDTLTRVRAEIESLTSAQAGAGTSSHAK
jgi:glycosyltransferase involved in cell wall biosynthesis